MADTLYTMLEDVVDIALMNHEEYTNQIQAKEQEIIDNDGYRSSFQETVNSYFDEETDLGGSPYADDIPVYSSTPADVAANDIIDAYHSLTNGEEMSIGDMIDLVADQR